MLEQEPNQFQIQNKDIQKNGEPLKSDKIKGENNLKDKTIPSEDFKKLNLEQQAEDKQKINEIRASLNSTEQNEKEHKEINGFDKGLEITLQEVENLLKGKGELLLSVAGKTGSGKSTFADGLSKLLHEKQLTSTTISSDNFYKEDRSGIDVKKLQETITKLQSGVPVDKLTPAQIIIVEGLQTIKDELLGQKADFRTYLKAPFSKRIAQRLVRDEQNNYRTIKDSLNLVTNMSDEDLMKFKEFEKEPDMSGVDIVVNNENIGQNEPRLYVENNRLNFAVGGEIRESIEVTSEQIKKLTMIGIS